MQHSCSKCYDLLTEKVTDISNVCQLVTFIKYFDYEFLDLSDLLEKSEEAPANADAIFNCLVAMLNQLGLELSDLKAFSTDGASVMTGVDGGVAAKLRRMDDCKTMIIVHCICHRLALACSDMGDKLQFVNNFELTMIQLWKFFKASPKRLRTYIRVGMQSKNFDAMSKRQKRKVVLHVKKPVEQGGSVYMLQLMLSSKSWVVSYRY